MHDREQVRVVLEPVLDIAMAGQLKQRLDQYVVSPVPLILDGSAVQRIDAAGLQLLCAFIQTAVGAGTRIEWDDISAPLREAAHLTGLEPGLAMGQA